MKERVLRRGFALVIDLFLISLVYSILQGFLPMEWMKGEQVVGTYEFRWDVDLYSALLGVYFLGCALLMRGGSPGKEILRLKTVMTDGSVPTRRLSLARTLLKLISIALLPFALLLYLWGGKETTLQDYLSGTRVERSHSVGIAR